MERCIIPLYRGHFLWIGYDYRTAESIVKTDFTPVLCKTRQRIVRFERLPFIFSYDIMFLLAV